MVGPPRPMQKQEVTIQLSCKGVGQTVPPQPSWILIGFMQASVISDLRGFETLAHLVHFSPAPLMFQGAAEDPLTGQPAITLLDPAVGRSKTVVC